MRIFALALTEPIPTAEIAAIQTTCSSSLQVRPWPHLERSDLVQVEFGPLQGVHVAFATLES